uniref:RAB38c, member of RAS oncogene family n=1 Tax=Hucho hucho TaxID=62062 RepID=A0A4W5N2T7_9TELE
MQQEHLLKVLVIADLGVSKTSVLHWDSDAIIRLQLWDIAIIYGNMTHVCYREAVGALGVFDVTHASTADDAVLKWKDDLDTKVTLSHGKPVPAVVLANKSDQVCSQQLKLDTFCGEKGFVGWFETSAKVREEDKDTDRETLQLAYCSPHSLSQLPSVGCSRGYLCNG